MGNLIKDKTAKKLEPICVWANPNDVTSFVGNRVSDLHYVNEKHLSANHCPDELKMYMSTKLAAILKSK